MKRASRHPKQTALTLALAAALASLAQAASADQTISGLTGGRLNWTSGNVTITNSGALIGGAGTSILGTGTSLGTLTNNGRIQSGDNQGVFNSGGTIVLVTNNGTISVNNQAFLNTGTVTTLVNAGLITAANYYAISNHGVIGTLNNSGTLTGGVSGVNNFLGSIGTLTNTGTITGSSAGVSNAATINSLTNNAGGTIGGGAATGLYNNHTIGTLTNSGTISGNAFGIKNDSSGTITGLTNNAGGVIQGGNTGIQNFGNLGSLTNSGVIGNGIYNLGTIGTLTNSGAISGIGNDGGITTLANSGTISDGITNRGGSVGTLTNSGTISGSKCALCNSATLGTINNAGVIAGDIQNTTSQTLLINGGTGSTFGTLTGYTNGTIGGVGTITNTNIGSNVVFGSGNLVLNDNINVGPFNAVTNTGATLQVNAPMTITGNYTQSAGATLQIGAGGGAVASGLMSSDVGYGRLVVSGTAVIAAGSSINLVNTGGYAFAAGQRFVVVDAAASPILPTSVRPLVGTNFNEGSLHYGINGYNSVLTGANVSNGSRSDLVVTVVSATPIVAPSPSPAPTPAPAPTSTPATLPNAISALTGLANYTGISDPALLNLFNAGQALNLGGSDAANRAGAQLSPVQHASATDGVAAPILDVLHLVSARTDSLRLAQADGNGTGIATGESPMGLAAWGQAFGGHANQSTRDQVDGYGATYGGLMVGADKAIGENWHAGGVFSYSNTLVEGRDNNTGDSTRVNGYGLTGYASYAGAPWYANVSGGVVQQRYNTNRAISFTGFSGVANGSFSGQQYVARAEGGYPLTVRNATLTPLASLTYSHLNQNSYTETGGNGAALAVGATHATSLRSSVGAKLEQGFETSYGKLIPEVQLQWVHEFNRNPAVTSASFAADPTGQTAFTTVGATPVSNLADLTLGVTLLRANNLSLSARYELQLAKGFVSQTGSLRLRQLF